MFVGAVLPLVSTVASSVGVWWLVCWLFAGYSVAMVGMLVVFHRDSVKLLLSQNFQWWKAMSYTRDMGLSLIARLAPLPLLAGSALIGPTLPAVIWGMQPMVWTFVLNSSNSRWSCSSKAWRAFILGFFGCVFTVLAQPADIRGDVLLLTTGACLQWPLPSRMGLVQRISHGAIEQPGVFLNSPRTTWHLQQRSV